MRLSICACIATKATDGVMPVNNDKSTFEQSLIPDMVADASIEPDPVMP